MASHRIAMPEDAVVQLFPGSDVPPKPVATLIRIQNTPEPVHENNPPNILTQGSMIITSMEGATYKGSPLPILMAMVMDLHSQADQIMLVSWWLPTYALQADMKPGRKKQVLDIFGSWRPADSLTLADIVGTKLPEVLVSVSSILQYNFKLRDGDKIPYNILDNLRNAHGIDLTGLSISLTPEGNLYRAYCLR